jgi:hypothetical protein
MVRDDIETGLLVQLDLPEYKDGFIRLHAIHRTDAPPGPAGSWLIARFVAQTANSSSASKKRSALSRSRNWG